MHTTTTTKTSDNGWAWRCQECGRRFKTAAAAERAAFGDNGCPNCGGSDIDLTLPVRREGAAR